MSRLALVVIMFGSGLLSSHLHAQYIPLEAEWGTTTWGRAGSAAAVAEGIDAFSTNPAGLAKSYGTGVFGGQYIDLPENSSSWGVGLIDGRKTVIGGFNFQWYDQNPAERQSYQIAAVYHTTYGAAGFTANIYRFEDLPTNNGWKLSQSAGIMVPLGYGFTVGAYGQSFLDNIESEVQAPFMAAGLAYHRPELGRLSFQADRQFDNPKESWNYSVSSDFILKEYFIVRGGYRFDQSDDKPFWTVGGGIEAPKLQVNGFYMRSMDSPRLTSWGVHTSFLF